MVGRSARLLVRRLDDLVDVNVVGEEGVCERQRLHRLVEDRRVDVGAHLRHLALEHDALD